LITQDEFKDLGKAFLLQAHKQGYIDIKVENNSESPRYRIWLKRDGGWVGPITGDSLDEMALRIPKALILEQL